MEGVLFISLQGVYGENNEKFRTVCLQVIELPSSDVWCFLYTHACSQSVTGLYDNLKQSPSTLFQFTESTLASLSRYVFYIFAYLSLSEAALIDSNSHTGKIGTSRIAGCLKA